MENASQNGALLSLSPEGQPPQGTEVAGHSPALKVVGKPAAHSSPDSPSSESQDSNSIGAPSPDRSTESGGEDGHPAPANGQPGSDVLHGLMNELVLTDGDGGDAGGAEAESPASAAAAGAAAKAKRGKRRRKGPGEEAPPVDPTRYKTKMCKNWEMHEKCGYGPRCQFAHGMRELRTYQQRAAEAAAAQRAAEEQQQAADLMACPSPMQSMGMMPTMAYFPTQMMQGPGGMYPMPMMQPVAVYPMAPQMMMVPNQPGPAPGVMMMPNQNANGQPMMMVPPQNNASQPMMMVPNQNAPSFVVYGM